MSGSQQLLQRVPVNETGRDFFIGDLHGCMAHLQAALKTVKFREDRDRLFSVGDLIDHGADPWGAIELLINKPWFHTVLGNHEAMALGFHQRLKAYWGPNVWMQNGGGWVRQIDDTKVERMLTVLSQLPLALEIPQRDGRVIGLIHAEIRGRQGWSVLSHLNHEEIIADDDQSNNVETGLLWARSQAAVNAYLMQHEAISLDRLPMLSQRYRAWVGMSRQTRGIDLLIAGHTITHTKHPFAIENRLSIDTGAYRREGALTLVEPMANRYFQIRWKKDGSGPLQKATRHRLPKPIRAWDVRGLLRAKVAASEAPQ